MVKRALTNPHFFLRHEENADDNSKSIYFGCEQEWYLTDWQKQTGCGPTTACNILSYIEFSEQNQQHMSSLSKKDGLTRLEESWKYITPGDNGIPSTHIFCRKFINLAIVKGISVLCNVIDIPQKKNQRPIFEEVVEFINKAMLEDSPVAFLNLCNGDESRLEKWHWVTIVSLSTDEPSDYAIIEIIDESTIKTIDLKLWYETTTLGGGFIYYQIDH